MLAFWACSHEVKVAPQLESEGAALPPELLLERLGFPRSEQYREVLSLSTTDAPE